MFWFVEVDGVKVRVTIAEPKEEGGRGRRGGRGGRRGGRGGGYGFGGSRVSHIFFFYFEDLQLSVFTYIV